jgi:hypothetical protein
MGTPIRQQRNKQNRRALSPSNPGRPADIVYSIGAVGNTTITISPLIDETQVVMGGLPKWVLMPGNHLPASMEYDGGDLTVEWGVPLPTGWSIQIPTGDFAFRSRWGGFLAAALIGQGGIAPPNAAILYVEWVVGSISGHTVTVAPVTGALLAATVDLTTWKNEATGAHPTSAVIDADVLVLTFAATPVAGQNITHTVPSSDVWMDGGRLLKASTHAITAMMALNAENPEGKAESAKRKKKVG